MDKRILWALSAAGGYVLLMSGGDLKNFSKLLQEHGMIALVIGGAAYFLLGNTQAGGPAQDFAQELADLPPQVQEQVINQARAAQQQQDLQGYSKGLHQPVAGFDPRYKPLGV